MTVMLRQKGEGLEEDALGDAHGGRASGTSATAEQAQKVNDIKPGQ